MKNYTYTIYHIKGIKIGLTTDLNHRMEEQGFTEYEIIDQSEGDYDYGWIMGDKELELQKQYGYRVDNSHYMISRNNRPKWGDSEEQSKYSKQVKNRYVFDNTIEHQSKAAKVAWSKHKDKMLAAAQENIKSATAAAAKSPNRASLQKFYCIECDKEITGAGPAGRHRKIKQHQVDKIKS
jgi:hypothetical protein